MGKTKLKPIDILDQFGCIIKFKDGNYANYFKNCLGKFLVFSECLAGFNLNKHYNDDLLYFDRERDFCDIEEIYQVDSAHFFGGNFNSFIQKLGMINKGLIKDTKSIKLVFKRED